MQQGKTNQADPALYAKFFKPCIAVSIDRARLHARDPQFPYR